MANIPGHIFGFLFLIVGFIYLIIVALFHHRYQKARLWIILLRELVPLLFGFACFANAFAIFDTRADVALLWYQLMLIAIINTEMVNIVYITYVIFGRLRATTGVVVGFFTGLNFSLLFFTENMTVAITPTLQVYYPAISPIFYITNLLLGIVHATYHAWGNLIVLRRRDITLRSKTKFFLFTLGISTFYTMIAVFVLATIIFQEGVWYFWTIVGALGGVIFIMQSIFYANPSVFFLPIRLYLLVIFNASGEIMYEKQFDTIHTTSALLVGPALASIASLVTNAFEQSVHLKQFSIPGRKLIYEWNGTTGAALIADSDSEIFRDCLQQSLKDVHLLSAHKEQFDTKIQEIFSFYRNEIHV